MNSESNLGSVFPSAVVEVRKIWLAVKVVIKKPPEYLLFGNSGSFVGVPVEHMTDDLGRHLISLRYRKLKKSITSKVREDQIKATWHFLSLPQQFTYIAEVNVCSKLWSNQVDKMDPNVRDERLDWPGLAWLVPSAWPRFSRTPLGCHSICVIKPCFHRQLEVYTRRTGRGENKNCGQPLVLCPRWVFSAQSGLSVVDGWLLWSWEIASQKEKEREGDLI